MNRDDELERAKKDFLYFLKKIMGFNPSQVHFMYVQTYNEKPKEIEPALTLEKFGYNYQKALIYKLEITQIIKVSQ